MMKGIAMDGKKYVDGWMDGFAGIVVDELMDR